MTRRKSEMTVLSGDQFDQRYAGKPGVEYKGELKGLGSGSEDVHFPTSVSAIEAMAAYGARHGLLQSAEKLGANAVVIRKTESQQSMTAECAVQVSSSVVADAYHINDLVDN